MLCELVDFGIHVHGAAGLSQDLVLAEFYAASRALRLADGPDAVHLMKLGIAEMKRSKL